MFSNYIYKWLETSLDAGLSEYEFWNMTLAEVIRALESKRRINLLQAQEKASYDYILADLIGRSVARIHSSSNQLPQIAEVYPTLFDKTEAEEKIQEKKDELSVLRFKQFAESFNNKFKKEAGENK